MLLIDSIYINSGGGYVLLRYLIETLIKKDVDFILLLDKRIQTDFTNVKNRLILSPSELARLKFYRHLSLDVTSILCFANVPPPIKINLPVYTYFHNINMLTLQGWPSKRKQFQTWLKREYIKLLKNNTDKWIVQTTNTQNQLIRQLKSNIGSIVVYPFYDIDSLTKEFDICTAKKDYALVGNYNNGAKGHLQLVKAWEMLAQKGYHKTLHLTVSDASDEFWDSLNRATQCGVRIINHGNIEFKQVANIYRQSKAIVYPSINESLGLGIVEAISMGCDVIASDLPFTHSICSPSIVFDRSNPDSIAGAIIKYETEVYAKSQLKIYNMIDELINLLVQ